MSRNTAGQNTVALPVNVQKRMIAERMVAVIARDISQGRVIKGVSRDFYAQVAGELANYFPGVRTGQVTFPKVLGTPSGAGAAKKTAPAKKKTARKPATRKPATRKTAPQVTPAESNNNTAQISAA